MEKLLELLSILFLTIFFSIDYKTLLCKVFQEHNLMDLESPHKLNHKTLH